jgi:hypothetical protein
MKTTIKKENVLLFIGIGILIVIFLNYNNLVLYKKNITSMNNNITSNNTIETFENQDGTQQIINNMEENQLPVFETVNNPSNEIKITDRLNKFLQFLVPTQNTETIPPIAYYNILKIQTKNFYKETKNLDNYNIFYNVNENELNDIQNPFVNTKIDIRKENTGSYPNVTSQSLINLSDGLSIDIGFLFNYKYPNSRTVPVSAVIKERGQDLTQTFEEINTYEQDELLIVPNTDTQFDLIIKLPHDDEKYPHLNYLKKDDKTSTKLYHKLKIRLYLKTNIYDIKTVYDDEMMNNKFPFLLKEIDISTSKLFYSIHTEDTYGDSSKVFEFSSLFMVDLLNNKENLNEYTKYKLKSLHMETLNDNYNNIVSDMFNLDNKITKKEKIVNDIKSYYLFNEISNLQTNNKFYNTY